MAALPTGEARVKEVCGKAGAETGCLAKVFSRLRTDTRRARPASAETSLTGPTATTVAASAATSQGGNTPTATSATADTDFMSTSKEDK